VDDAGVSAVASCLARGQRCAEGEVCFAGGSCMAGIGPGAACLDAFGDAVWEGDRGVRVCSTDPALVEQCTCGGGGATAWLACEPCVRSCEPPGAPGLPCTRDADCGPSLACHPTLNVCGVRCDRGLGVVCPGGATCTIPGDIAGVCLPTCTCGSTECGLGWTCAPSEIGGADATCQPGDGLLGSACS
jgi:hypothetical protein